MFLKLMLISVALVGLAFVGFSITILVKKNGQFPETRVGHNKTMRRKKIYCVKTEQKILDKRLKKDQGVSYTNDNISCSGC